MSSPLTPTDTRPDCPVCIREAETHTTAALGAFDSAAELFVAAAGSLVAEARKPTRLQDGRGGA